MKKLALILAAAIAAFSCSREMEVEIPNQVGNDRRITVDAPYGRMPLYVRGGSIVPIGPEMEWSAEKPADDILLAVYAGADAQFILYEDDGLTYDYEKGRYSAIPIRWVDSERTLLVGAREGSYPGMPQERSFRVVVIDADNPQPWNPDAEGVLKVQYSGNPFEAKL